VQVSAVVTGKQAPSQSGLSQICACVKFHE